jgi:hypothetical protein
MVNNENILEYSLDAGANALEMDLNFDTKGYPTTFYHSKICDCICGKPESCKFKVCDYARPASDVLSYFMAHKKMGQVAMLYLDSKMGDMSETLMKQAGAHMITFLEKEVMLKGYKGIVFIGGVKEDYIGSLAKNAEKSAFKSQIFVGFDLHKNFEKGLRFLAGLDYPNKIAAAGMVRCLKWAISYKDEAILGRINKARGVISDVIIWTLDKEEEFDKYYGYGARGIITNNIQRLVGWANKRGYELYSTKDTVCSATAGKENLVTELGDCGCEKNGDGCRIDRKDNALVQGYACKCAKQWFLWWIIGCKGDVVGCKDVTSAQCINPDASLMSCKQGGGDCKGY